MNIDLKTKMIGLVEKDDEHSIVVTHVTIRQSIFFLLLKLLVLEVIAAGCIITFHSLLLSATAIERMNNFTVFNIPLFIVLIVIKTILMMYIVIEWMNDYYEITPKEVIHKKGLIFKKEERHAIKHLGSLKIEQGVLGRIFNYGTLNIFNWAIEKDFSLYLIHNPMKYHHILETLIPEVDEQKQVFREHLLYKERV